MHLTAKDFIFNARHIDYIHLKSRVRVSVFLLFYIPWMSHSITWKDVVEKILKLEGIFLSPHCTKIVVKEIGDKCCNVKNSFRKAVNSYQFTCGGGCNLLFYRLEILLLVQLDFHWKKGFVSWQKDSL